MKRTILKTFFTSIFVAVVILIQNTAPVFAQWSTTDPTYDTGSWSTTYPTYDTGSWSTTYPTYDTGSWSTTYPTYDTGSWSTTYPTYDTGSWSTTYPTYDTGTTYPTYSTGTTYPTYSTGVTYPTYDTGTTYSSYTTPTYNIPSYTNFTIPTIPSYGYTNYGSYTSPTVSVSVANTNCPAGTTLINNVCTANTTTATVYNNAWCQSIGWDYITNSTLGYCSCNSGRTYVGGDGSRGGSCQSTTTTCPSGTSLVNGVCTTNTQTCSAGNIWLTGIGCTNCQSGSTWNGTSCVANTVTCPVGSSYVNGSCQVNTITCPAGSYLVNGVCTSGSINCPAGSYYVNGICTTSSVVTYQTCWDGSVIPSTSVCSQQYKTCANGSTVPVTQTCYKYCSNGTTIPDYQTCPYNYYPNNNYYPTTSYLPWVNLTADRVTVPYGGNINLSWTSQNATYCTASNGWGGNKNTTGFETRPVYGVTTYAITCYNSTGQSNTSSVTVYTGSQTVKFNNVVTSIATQITNNSARCNGIGLIANGAQSTGWFEYGETATLGRATAKAAIGSADTAPFSNVLASLKPNTKYYCRAVMDNQYGIVKGEIVSFITKSKAVTYVTPKAVSTIKKVVPKKKDEYVCADGSIAKLSSETTAGLLNSGDKLVTLNLDKVTGNLSPSGEVTYRLGYKNISDTHLNDVVVKISIPQEFTPISTSIGNYDEDTHTLTFNQNILEAYNDGVITWKIKVKDGAMLGKSVVTTGYVSYTIKTDKKAPLQDEVVAYSVGSISPSVDASDISAKKVVGTSTMGFLPSSLIEWFALVAIMFILFILGRSIYATYQEEEKH